MVFDQATRWRASFIIAKLCIVKKKKKKFNTLSSDKVTFQIHYMIAMRPPGFGQFAVIG